jgi:uncharacterized protein (DUF58 family)
VTLWKRLRGALSRRMRYRITRGGVLFTLAILAVMLAAVFSTNNLLFLVAAAMMATLLVSGLISRLCLAALELDFIVPEHVSADRLVPGRLAVRNQKWLMPSFSIRVEGVHEAAAGSPPGPALESGVYFPLIAGGATVEETVQVRFPRRGTYRENGFAFSTGFPFGFLEKSARVTLRRETVVYPSIQPQPGFEDLLLGIAGEIETHYRGLGKDFYRIRPYEVLESARHVDWKATAHVGALQVREFAREQERRVEMFLDRDVPHALDAWFEHAIDCCAFLAWRLSNDGASIHFRSNGFSFRQPEEGDIYTILKYLALVYAQGASAAEGPIEESSYKLVFTANPQKFSGAGWMEARILSPANLRPPC